MTDGFINLLKPPGPSSHDLVTYVRRKTGLKRVGHTGTLDPLAAGVLVIAIGRATRLIPYLETTKTYIGEITFGIATDTLDAGGCITATRPAKFSRGDLEAVLKSFKGMIPWVPPMVSALKWRGRRLYDLAREGIEVDRPARTILIQRLELVSFCSNQSHPRALIKCVCSAGTYMRSLAADIGTALGCSSYLSFLLRAQNGPFAISTSLTLEEFEKQLKDSPPSHWLIQPLDALTNLPVVGLDDQKTTSFLHGRPIPLRASQSLPDGATPVCLNNKYNTF